MTVGKSPEHDSEEESGVEKDPESAAVVLERLDLNGGPPFSARQYASGSEFSLTSEDDISDEDYVFEEEKETKKKRKKKRKILRVACDECCRFFVSQKALLKHKLVHLGTYTCQVCEKRCVSSTSLKLHSRMHSNNKTYACDECDAAFAFLLQLLTHRHRTHEGGVMPYSCQQCDRAFAQKHHLSAHMVSHEQTFHECDFCGTGFKTVLRMKLHVQRVHSVRKKLDEDTEARRSGRTARIDYNDDVINVEVAKEYKRKKHAVKAVDRVPKVASRLRQREDMKPRKKSGKRGKPGKLTKWVNYMATGAKPSRSSARVTSAVNYGGMDSDQESSEEEEEEEQEQEGEVKNATRKPQPRNTGRGRRISKIKSPGKSQESGEEEEREEEEQEQEGEVKKATRKPQPRNAGRSRRVSERKSPRKSQESGEEEGEEEEQEQEGEMKKSTPKPQPRNAGRSRRISERKSPRKSQESGDEEEEEGETEPVEMPGRGGRRSAATTREAVNYGGMESDEQSSEEEEVKKAKPKPQPKSAVRGHEKSMRERITEETNVVETSPQHDRGEPKKLAPAENGSDDEEEEETEPVETPRRGGRRSAAPTPKTSSVRKSGRAKRNLFQESDQSNEDEDNRPPASGRRDRGRLTPARRLADLAESEVSDGGQVVNRRTTPRFAGGRGDASVAPSTPQRGRRTSAPKKPRTDESDSGVEEAEVQTTPARRASVKRARQTKGSAGSDEEERSEEKEEEMTLAAGRGKRGKEDESTMPPKKRLRGRQ